jgi:hypothetical protein
LPAGHGHDQKEFDDDLDMYASLTHLPKAGELRNFLLFWTLVDEVFRFDPDEVIQAEQTLKDFKQRMNHKAELAGQPLPFPEIPI